MSCTLTCPGRHPRQSTKKILLPHNLHPHFPLFCASASVKSVSQNNMASCVKKHDSRQHGLCCCRCVGPHCQRLGALARVICRRCVLPLTVMPVMMYLFDMRMTFAFALEKKKKKKSEIINYTWVTGSDRPSGTVLSSREMPSICALKLSGNKRTTIL